ncbi:MAG: HD domain-containing response regulator [Eubacteriales bacterium]|nr:HD domain-containing response regulator [Eubacteriales bacterium]
MRKNRLMELSQEYRIMIIDDEPGIIDSIQALLNRNGYWCCGFTNPLEGLAEIQNNHYDLLVLDYFMQPVHGETVVEEIRKTNSELYILLLTGHKDLAPPISTIKSLDIQAYCEKSDRLDQLQLLIESGIKAVSQMRTIQQFRDGLQSILGAVPKIYQLQPIGTILEEILTQLLPMANSADAFILVDDIPGIEQGQGEKTNRSIFKGIGKYHVNIDEFPELLDHELMEAIGRARTEMTVINHPNGVIIPLGDETNAAIGAIYVSSIDADEGIKLLQIYARQAASSISNAFLHSLVNIKNEELNSTYAQLKIRYMDTIEVLRLAVDAKDEYTRGHSDRVAYYATKIGKLFGLPAHELEELRIAGIFHDIGKIGTADDILLKKQSLDKMEYEQIKQHPIKGAMILSAVSMFHDIVPIVRHHHEHIDGSGYPDGLKGDEIEMHARIISVADAFDAMMSDRHYRRHLSMDETKKQLSEGVDTQFDARVVEAFLNALSHDRELLDMITAARYDG